jgi:hypothetical protein
VEFNPRFQLGCDKYGDSAKLKAASSTLAAFQDRGSRMIAHTFKFAPQYLDRIIAVQYRKELPGVSQFMTPH